MKFKKARVLFRHLWSWVWSKSRYKFYVKNNLNNIDFKSANSVINSQVFQQLLLPLQVDIPVGKRVLVIAPHPDDEILGAAGLIIKAKKSGCHISIIFLTSGAVDNYVVIEKEARQVSDKIGVDDVYFLRMLDGGIIDVNVDETELQKVVGKCRPDIISLPFIFDGHTDHIYTNKLICNIDFEDSKKIDFWAYQIYSSIPTNVVIDITSIVDYKFDLMKVYKSQLNDFDFINWNKGLNAWNSVQLKSKQGKYAECYFVVPFKQYIELCNIFFLR